MTPPQQLLQTAGREWQARCSVEQVALIGGELPIELIGVEKPIALLRCHPAHTTDGVVESAAAIGGQLFELPKEGAGLILLPGR